MRQWHMCLAAATLHSTMEDIPQLDRARKAMPRSTSLFLHTDRDVSFFTDSEEGERARHRSRRSV